MSLVEWWGESIEKLSTDSVLLDLIKKYPKEGLKKGNRPFHTLARSIVGQQISVLAADSIWRKLEDICQGKVTPLKIRNHSIENLRNTGLSFRKSEYLLEIAKKNCLILDICKENDVEIIKRKLREIRGIGEWTAEMFLIFALGKKDIFPLGDVGLIRGLNLVFPETIEMEKEEIKNFSKRWIPWRTTVTWYLWRRIDPVPVDY